ncbi:HK97 gp10 family phage protein [Herbidospora sp. RD11066]
MAGGGGEELRRLIGELGKIPKELRAALRPVLRKVVDPIFVQAKANAAWSSRIPGAMRITTTFSGRRPGIAITVSKKKAPNARPLENLGMQGMIRRPVFGHRDRWVQQRARPFLFPAVTAKANVAMAEEVGRVVDQVARENGFR